MFAKGRVLGVRLKAVDVNGQPGAMFFDAEDRLINVMAVDIADGVVYCVRSIVNPDKLGHLGPLSDLTRLPSRPE
jgi:RNA polymerase sigma-70 factor (ECF subfamily)